MSRRSSPRMAGGSAPIPPDGPAGHVQLDVCSDADEISRRCGALRSAQHRPHPRHQLLRAERLRQIVVGAQLQADQLVRLLGPRGQHDDRDLSFAAQGAGDVQAIQSGQSQVQHHKVGPARAHSAERGRPIDRREHGEPTVLEIVADQLHDPRLVVHHKDGRHGDHPRCRHSCQTERVSVGGGGGVVPEGGCSPCWRLCHSCARSSNDWPGP